MSKYVILLIVPLFFCFGTPSEASQIDYEKKRIEVLEQRNELKNQIADLKNEVTAIEDEEEKQPKIKAIIQLTMNDNKLAGYEKAYEKALGIVRNPVHTVTNISFQKVDLLPGQLVPAPYIPIYKAAGERYGVEWTLLAAIHKVETDFSRIKNMISYAGAIGHMQFMPKTFEVYGVDGNGNGAISPWELEDAIFSAANYLSSSGIEKNVRKAVWHYNHSESYIDKVLGIAETIREVSH